MNTLKLAETDLKSKFVLTNQYFVEGIFSTAKNFDLADPRPFGIGPQGLLVSDNLTRFFTESGEWVEKKFAEFCPRLFLSMWREMARFNRTSFKDVEDFLKRYQQHEQNVALMHVLDWAGLSVARKHGFFGLQEHEFLLACNPPVSLLSQDRVRAGRMLEKGVSDHLLLRMFGWQYPDSILSGNADSIKESVLDPETITENMKSNEEFFDLLSLTDTARNFILNLQMIRYIDSGYHKHALTGRAYSTRIRESIGKRAGVDKNDVLYLTSEEIVEGVKPADLEQRKEGKYFIIFRKNEPLPVVEHGEVL